ncbi:MAG: hypothetical protein HY803_02005 [candidate division NC10 bacterium]|nr:hypothetical protein [candidate division NC10 bacterium]
MGSCEEIAKRMVELGVLPAAELPSGIRDHLAGCPACARWLTAARVTRGILAAATDTPEPPARFASQVLAALPGARSRRADADLWRLGWGLVPAFAATVVLLLALYQASPVPAPTGLMPVEGLSVGERLVLEPASPELDAVLAAVMEGGGT